jgi:RNA polymerase sigma-70 factor (ECF subfamily)
MLEISGVRKEVETGAPGSHAAMDGAHGFATTHWSVVLAAGQNTAPAAAAALETLCETYWYPLYAWLRRQGYGMHDAQDLTQSFLVHLLEKHRLPTVHPDKGKFRSFLLASLKHFLTNEWDKARALKRGGELKIVSIDDEEAEGRFQREPAHQQAPDKVFEQSWAATLLESVLKRLKAEYAADGRTALFDRLQPYLSGDRGGAPYAEVAARLGLGESGVKMAVLRLRRRFGELLRAEIANTVSKPEEIDEEIRCLFAAVSG